MTRRDIDAAERTAAVVERLAALLAGGATPVSAWQHVAKFAAADVPRRPDRPHWKMAVRRATVRLLSRRPSPTRRQDRTFEPVELSVARAARAGQHVWAVLREHDEASWRALGCAWSLAERTGAPLARGLADLAETFRDFGAAEREVELALAGPRSAARLVMGLPAVGVLLGLALGFDNLGMLLGTPVGLACLAGGLALMAAAQLWNRALIAAASKREQLPGLALDLTALGMLGGASALEVLEQVKRALESANLDGNQRLRPGDTLAERHIERVLALAREAGVPAASLLRSEAALERRDARSRSSTRAAQLGVRLMLPLGLCVLPAFLLLGVAPLILAVVTQTISRL